MFYDADGRLRSMLASWTNIDEPDAFTQAGGGQSHLRLDDLRELVILIGELKGSRKSRGSVK